MKKLMLFISGGLFLTLPIKAQNMAQIQKGKKQFSNSITFNAPIQKVWDVITDSKQMEIWGPPVQKVEVELSDTGAIEKVGSVRIVDVIFLQKTGVLQRTKNQSRKP